MQCFIQPVISKEDAELDWFLWLFEHLLADLLFLVFSPMYPSLYYLLTTGDNHLFTHIYSIYIYILYMCVAEYHQHFLYMGILGGDVTTIITLGSHGFIMLIIL